MSTTVTIDVDGDRSPEYAMELGDAMYEAVRALNHITMGSATLPHASDVYRLLGELQAAAAGLPQLCAQIASRLEKHHETGRLSEVPGGRYGGDTDAAVTAALGALTQAQRHGRALQEALAAAHSATAGLETQ